MELHQVCYLLLLLLNSVCMFISCYFCLIKYVTEYVVVVVIERVYIYTLISFLILFD